MARWRSVLGTIVLVVAGLLVPVALVATWSARTVTDTETFVDRVAPVAAQPEVQRLAEQQITETVDRVVIEGLVGSRVDDAIEELEAPPLVKVLLRNLATSAGGWAEERVARASHRVVTAPQFQTAFRESLETAHAELVGTLEGDTDQALVADDRTVSIKVATLTNAVREELVAAGVDVAAQIPEVEATIPIATVDQLEQWRTYYGLLKVLVWLGPLLVVVLVAAGWWLRRGVAVSTLWFAGAAVVGVVGVTWAARAAVGAAVEGIADPDAAAAARSIVQTLTSSLVTNAQLSLVVLLLALVAALVAVLRPRFAGADPRLPWRSRVSAPPEG